MNNMRQQEKYFTETLRRKIHWSNKVNKPSYMNLSNLKNMQLRNEFIKNVIECKTLNQT